MRFKRHHFELETGRLDVTPLVDVVFNLLLFFMLSSSFISQPAMEQAIKIKLPSAITSEVVPKENLEIIITDKDYIYVKNKRITIAELSSRLRIAAEAKTAVMIKADKSASLGKIVEIWDLCRQFGMSNVNIATLQAD